MKLILLNFCFAFLEMFDSLKIQTVTVIHFLMLATKEDFESLDCGPNITDLILSIGIFLKIPKQSLFNHSLMPVDRYDSSKN